MTERACYGMKPEQIPPGIYTHIKSAPKYYSISHPLANHHSFAFATIDPITFEIKPGDSNTEALMQRIGSIKILQPDVEIWVAVGGWTFNDPWLPTARTFGNIAASERNQDKFIDSVNKLMNTYGFDGIDIDWYNSPPTHIGIEASRSLIFSREYPGADDRAGSPEDFKNFVSFTKRLKAGINGGGQKKGLSLTLPSSYWCKQ